MPGHRSCGGEGMNTKGGYWQQYLEKNKAEIFQMYYTYSCPQIARIISKRMGEKITGNTIRNFLDTAGAPMRKRGGDTRKYREGM